MADPRRDDVAVSFLGAVPIYLDLFSCHRVPVSGYPSLQAHCWIPYRTTVIYKQQQQRYHVSLRRQQRRCYVAYDLGLQATRIHHVEEPVLGEWSDDDENRSC